MAAGGHIGNVTWKQIDIESCVIPLLLLIFAWRIHFWHRSCILTSPTNKIQVGRMRPYWKCNLKVNGHRNPCNITFPTKCGIVSPFLVSFLYFDESEYQNSRWPPSTNTIFSCFEPYNPYYLLNFTRETRFQLHVFISWYHLFYFDTGIISFFLSIIAHRAHFGHHLCILTGLNVKTQDGRPLPFPLFSELSHPIHCSCWMLHQKLVSSNLCGNMCKSTMKNQQWSPRKR